MSEHSGDVRKLPDVLFDGDTRMEVVPGRWARHRDGLVDKLSLGEYGRMPTAPEKVMAVIEGYRDNDFGSHVRHTRYRISFDTPHGPFSFPVDFCLPQGDSKVPVMVHIAFTGDIPNPSFPVSDVCESGVGVVSFCYEDVVPDREDALGEGLAGCYRAWKRKGDGCGTIGYWAFAIHRVVDFLMTHARADKEQIAVMGHSRLGKTALWSAATDERISMAVSVQSGCGGAAISRGKQGERINNIVETFPHWFCKNFRQYGNNEDVMPFDQHFLLASIAPRLLYVCSATNDEWADPPSEYLGCLEASPAWRVLGVDGLIGPDHYPGSQQILHEGRIGYHARVGGHALTPEDWHRVLAFWKRHRHF